MSIDDLPFEIASPQRERLLQALRFFDRNGNGVLDPDERNALLKLFGGNN